MPNLQRFIDAQKKDYAQAKREIETGKKTSHWIWYIFPQLKDLGSSENAKFYGIKNFDEACNYLRNPTLFHRYYEMIQIIERQLSKKPRISLTELMGSKIDANKFVSSLTLFRGAAAFLELQPQKPNYDYKDLKRRCDKIYTIIAEQHYSPCRATFAYMPPGLGLQKTKVTLNRQPNTSLFNPLPTKPRSNKSNKHHSLKTPIKSPIIPKLENYIQKRNNEWSFHYNFLGIVALVYLIQDAILGTHYFNTKNRDIKISAATKLKQMLCSNFQGQIKPLTSFEKGALREGELGKIVHVHGGLKKLLTKASTHRHNESDPERNLKLN